MSAVMFNLNYYSEEETLHMFWSWNRSNNEIEIIVEWTSGNIIRSCYCADLVFAVFIVVRKFYSWTRRTDIEKTFGIYPSAVSEMFFEVPEKLFENHGHH